MPKGIQGFQKGYKMSEQHRQNIIKSLLGNKRTLGFKPTEETKNKLRKINSEHPTKYWLGKKHSPEMIAKRVASNMARPRDKTKLKKSENRRLNSASNYWSREVKIRDKWKCRLLSSDCLGKIQAHHIYNWVDYPTLRYIITNGITLCKFHHPRGRENELQMRQILQELLHSNE